MIKRYIEKKRKEKKIKGWKEGEIDFWQQERVEF